MDSITQKQILDWKEELDKQKQTKLQAEQVLANAIKSIDMLEGGIQFGEMLLKKNESSDQQSNTTELTLQSRKAPSKK
tara:strand:- start:553 stop:786 length:234 start_codon:yes stop_codon:yes gene_type:complete